MSRAGGQIPTWRDDGREIYFVDPEGASAVALAERGGALEVGSPDRLPFSRTDFSLGAARGGGAAGGSTPRSQDGKRFLLQQFDSGAVSEPLRLVRSWRRLVE